MSRRFKAQSESLDLLLDTICNAFGGIIFIACLITLLVRETDTGPNPALEEARSGIVARALDTAKAELERLKFLIASQEEKKGPSEGMAEEVEKRRIVVTDLRTEAEKVSRELPKDTTGALQEMIAHSQPLRKNFEEMELVVAKQETHLKDLREQLAATERGRTAALHKSKQNVRLPLEKGSSKKQFSVILKYHRVYHVRDTAGLKNTTDINFEGDEIRPRDGKGAILPKDRATLLAQLSAIHRDQEFVVVVIYPDSHDIWRDYFQLVHVEAGLEYGLMFFSQDQIVRFGENNVGTQ